MKKQHLAVIVAATFTMALLATAADDLTNAPATDASVTNAPPEAAKADQPVALTPVDTAPVPTNGLVLNFHDVPLNAVLTYLSAKAGLIIVSDVNLQGRVTVIAAQPIATNDIVDLLNDQLGKNNFSAMLQGRTLTIMDSERAKTYALTPVKVANQGFTNIPINDEIVTEILPLHTLQAQQLIKDLADLIPRSAIVTANEAGNSILMTGQQKDVRRIDQIVNSLDGTALSDVEVFQMKYADSKAVADELKEVFQSADSDITRASTRNSIRTRGGGGGPFGGGNPMAAMFGGGPGGGGNGGSENNVSTKSVFVADDQMNAVIASAPPGYMLMISNVIDRLDQPSQEVTVMRVFHLNHADPGEIADELTTMFPSGTSSTDQNNRTPGMRFMGGFGGFGGFGGGGQQAGNSQSPRMKRELAVSVVPDRRTQSVIVSASKEMMVQIQGVIEDLDQGTQGVQHVTALDFGAADPATVQETLSGLFSSVNNSRNQQSTTQSATPIGNRYTGNANAQTTTAQSTTTSGAGVGGSSGLH
jgi:type II secretory pathway component GspD/PulD (secretin)